MNIPRLQKQETRPALGPKGIDRMGRWQIRLVGCHFSQARLLLVITVHDILSAHDFVVQCTTSPTPCGPGHGQFHDGVLLHVISCTYIYIWYGIVPTLHRDSQNITLQYLAAQCTVQYALKVVVTREES